MSSRFQCFLLVSPSRLKVSGLPGAWPLSLILLNQEGTLIYVLVSPAVVRSAVNTETLLASTGFLAQGKLSRVVLTSTASKSIGTASEVEGFVVVEDIPEVPAWCGELEVLWWAWLN